jgi:hypothetical protein
MVLHGRDSLVNSRTDLDQGIAETVVVVPKVVDDSSQTGNLSLLVASFETLKALFEECNAVFGPFSCGPLC